MLNVPGLKSGDGRITFRSTVSLAGQRPAWTRGWEKIVKHKRSRGDSQRVSQSVNQSVGQCLAAGARYSTVRRRRGERSQESRGEKEDGFRFPSFSVRPPSLTEAGGGLRGVRLRGPCPLLGSAPFHFGRRARSPCHPAP